ncbi:hypothetical protein BN137_3220 [Cronobacter condimenti 1330]|uniref:SnoaL-like domain-containing protein n=1 Tax=Cronobacter condimenti 1330 TaxID=1073999 RepID=K8A2G4_9ENTR|nr:hypothetical protein [Cronobacter condimenti]CCJ73831.1 hypothetical protein BN137_3220 [Cronobacter condimenti 1330]
MSANNVQRVAAVCEKFRTLDMEIIMSCFTKEVTVNYNQLDTLRGKAALNEFLTPRYRVLGDYQLDKKSLWKRAIASALKCARAM